MKDPVVRWLIRVPGRKKLYIVVLTVLQALYGGSGVLYALLFKGLVDAAVGSDLRGFWRYLLLLALLTAGQLLLRAVIRVLAEMSRSALENHFKLRLTDTLLHRSLLQVSAVHSGEWLNRLTSDVAVTANAYTEILPGIAGMAVKLVSALVMLLLLEPRFAYAFIPGGLLMVLLTWTIRRKLKLLHRRIQEADGRLRVFLTERIRRLLMIRSYAAEERTLEAAREWMRAHRAARLRRVRFAALANVGFGAAMNGMYLLGAGLCGYGILIGTVSFGTLAAVTQLVTQIQSPFANLSGYLPRFYAMLASAERLMEAEALPEDAAPAMGLEELQELYRDRLLSFGLRDASFAYCPAAESPGELSKEGMPAVVEHLDLEIRKGEYVAFTGPSGCGKSTVLRLLMCVYPPDSGKRFVTLQSGEERELDQAYRRLFTYVPQGNQLISGTVRDAVCFAEPGAAHDEERLRQALRAACAEDFVYELEAGPDTRLGEMGSGLSEGQMQRLAIARAIFSASPILLLDEATSALDGDTERQLLENLRKMTDRTVIIVTHRPAALSICDRVLEFSEGGVIVRGD